MAALKRLGGGALRTRTRPHHQAAAQPPAILHKYRRRKGVCGGETPPTPPLPPAAWRGPSLRRPSRGLLLPQAQRGQLRQAWTHPRLCCHRSRAFGCWVGHFPLASQSTEREPQESACFIVRTNCCSTTVQHELDEIKMYTSKKRGHVNAFASRLLRVDSKTLLRDQECNATGTDRIAFRTTRRLEVAFR